MAPDHSASLDMARVEWESTGYDKIDFQFAKSFFGHEGCQAVVHEEHPGRQTVIPCRFGNGWLCSCHTIS